MKDHSKAKGRAEGALRGQVFLVEEIPLQGGSLQIWAQALMRPARKVAIFEGEDGSMIVTSRSLSSFEKFLRASRPDLENERSFLLIFGKAMPGRRAPALEESDVLEKHKEIWRPPRFDGDQLVFFCINYETGMFERVVVSSDHRISLTEVGRGARMIPFR